MLNKYLITLIIVSLEPRGNARDQESYSTDSFNDWYRQGANKKKQHATI